MRLRRHFVRRRYDRRVTLTGYSTVVAGGGNLAEGDGGPATQALLNHPTGVALDSIGNLFIADRANNRIRRVGLDGTITTVAGLATPGNSGDGGAAMLAALNGPTSVTFDSFGNLFIADTGNARIRVVTPGGIILPLATPVLSAPAYMMFDSAKNLYIADTAAIFKITPSGVTTALFAGLESPRGMVIDPSGNFYFSEPSSKQVWMFTPSGTHSLIAAGAWNSPHRSALGRALDHWPFRQSNWNQRTRSAAMQTTMSQAAFAWKFAKGKRISPESLRRAMWFST